MKKVIGLSLICGLALMTAPGTNYDLPLKQWTFAHSFDTAKDCEEFVLPRYIRSQAKNDQDGMRQNAAGNRCIPIDWIRPSPQR